MCGAIGESADHFVLEQGALASANEPELMTPAQKAKIDGAIPKSTAPFRNQRCHSEINSAIPKSTVPFQNQCNPEECGVP
jgi:hypothetical protein